MRNSRHLSAADIQYSSSQDQIKEWARDIHNRRLYLVDGGAKFFFRSCLADVRIGPYGSWTKNESHPPVIQKMAVCLIDGKIIGWAVFGYWEYWRAMVYVQRQYRHQGIGRQLINKVSKRLMRSQLPEVFR